MQCRWLGSRWSDSFEPTQHGTGRLLVTKIRCPTKHHHTTLTLELTQTAAYQKTHFMGEHSAAHCQRCGALSATTTLRALKHTSVLPLLEGLGDRVLWYSQKEWMLHVGYPSLFRIFWWYNGNMAPWGCLFASGCREPIKTLVVHADNIISKQPLCALFT